MYFTGTQFYQLCLDQSEIALKVGRVHDLTVSLVSSTLSNMRVAFSPCQLPRTWRPESKHRAHHATGRKEPTTKAHPNHSTRHTTASGSVLPLTESFWIGPFTRLVLSESVHTLTESF